MHGQRVEVRGWGAKWDWDACCQIPRKSIKDQKILNIKELYEPERWLSE